MTLFESEHVVDRKNTASIKWDEVEKAYEEEDILPFWIADMDFKAPQPVLAALQERVQHGVFGYTSRTDTYDQAIMDWLEKRHRWSIEKDWICHAPGIVPALSFIVQIFTEPEDEILIQPPVYHPFYQVTRENGRKLVQNPLKLEHNRYVIDFEDLESKLKTHSVKLFLLCSPHNPVGRVWTKEELQKLGELCRQYNILVVSDEIHFDLVFKPFTHTPFASISEELAQRSIICTAPSKTFNLAGLQTSNLIIPNSELRERFKRFLSVNFLGLTNTFGQLATEAAYRAGEEWLENCLQYLQENLNFLMKYIAEHIPTLKVIKAEGTYLIWIDCRGLNMDDQRLRLFMRHEAKVAVNEGVMFGEGGSGFIRMNIACSRALLEEGLSRIKKAVDQL